MSSNIYKKILLCYKLKKEKKEFQIKSNFEKQQQKFLLRQNLELLRLSRSKLNC